ncbi:hypothetical protein LCGC14_2459750, partial [marine sediment metagenome]
DGQDLLVDYSVSVSRQGEFVADRITWSNRLGLKSLPLAIYFNYTLDDRRLESGDDPGNLETEEVHLVGIQLDHEGLSALIEHERVQQKLSPPTRTTRAEASYTGHWGPRLTYTVGGHIEKLSYRDAAAFDLEPGEEFQDSCGAYATLSVKLSRRTLLRLEADYTSSRGQDNDRLGRIGAVFEWKIGDLDFSVEGRHSEFKQESNAGTEDILLFNLSRRF